jgi:hypothetical protein
LGSAFALSLFTVSAPAALAADPSPGDETITINVGDSAAGGDVFVTFEKAYANSTVDGTDVYVYVPEGSIGNEDVFGMSPALDPTPGDEFDPCPTKFEAGDYLITQDQIDTLGDELTNQIVRVDEEHYGEIGLADPSDPDSDALVVLAYNVFDDFFYDCDANTYTAGFFAPGFIDQYGMNVIVTDTFDWANRVGGADPVYEGVIAHELEHLLMNYSDPGELSWVDEGLADMAIFFNEWGNTNDSHILYHQVFHRETSLTRWGGGLENYGASYTYFLYLWEQAGGNGGGDLGLDLDYDDRNGDRLIKLIFENEADGMLGVQAAINEYNATLKAGEAALRTAEELFKDWAIAIYLDTDDKGTFDFQNLNFGDAITSGWTIELANDLFFGNRGQYNGNVSIGRWEHSPKVPTQTALPFGVSYETFRNPGPNWTLTFDGEDITAIAPAFGEDDLHWYAGYESLTDNILNVDAPTIMGGEIVAFDTWFFIEYGWDYGYVEELVNGTWETLPIYLAGTTTQVTTNFNPQGQNAGVGFTGTSGGTYFVDDPEYLQVYGTLSADATDVRFRYSTDAAYLDTGWFVDNVTIDGAVATLTSPDGDWFETTGIQDNNWAVQIISACDLTPGVETPGETTAYGGYLYRFEGDQAWVLNGTSECLRGTQDAFVVVVSNMPTGDLQYLDATYEFRLVNTGNGKK